MEYLTCYVDQIEITKIATRKGFVPSAYLDARGVGRRLLPPDLYHFPDSISPLAQASEDVVAIRIGKGLALS